MKKLLFICLMAISSLFVFADGKTTCKVSGLENVVATIQNPKQKSNGYGLYNIIVKLSKAPGIGKEVTVTIKVLDSKNTTVTTEFVKFKDNHDYQLTSIMNRRDLGIEFKSGEEYKIEIDNASCKDN